MKIVVIADGGWGTALATLLAGAGHEAAMWTIHPDYARQMARKRENTRFLPGIRLPDSLTVTGNPDVFEGAELLVEVVPTPYLRTWLGAIEREAVRGIPLVSATKGIENKTLKRPSEIIVELLGERPIAVLSGPSHAEEVARGLPASVVAASEDEGVARMVQDVFSTDTFRVYRTDDVVGVELCGALKNIIGLAAGVCDGLGFGDNTKAALLTRGLAEIARLGVAMGARAETFRGLAGMGDVITTCVSPHGRNRAVGMSLAAGKSLEDIQADMHGMVAEGVFTTRSAVALAEKTGVEMPITREVYRILFEGKSPRRAVADLMTRELRSETETFGA